MFMCVCMDGCNKLSGFFPGISNWGFRNQRGYQEVGGLGDGSPPVGSRGEAPVGGLGDEVPQKLKHFNNYELVFLLSDNSKRQ